MSSSDHPKGQVPVPVWDLPVRLFHWSVVALVAVQAWTGFTGGNAMVWHVRCGVALLALALFRILWGFLGSTHARFADFLRGPAATLATLRALFSRAPLPHAGHNPAGGWMVLALVLALAAQAGTGLFSNDDIVTDGPLAAWVGKELSDALTGWHKGGALLLLGLAGVHILAVAWHRLAKGENLVTPMITGVKYLPPGTPQPRNASLARAAALATACAAAVYFLVTPPH